MGIEIRGPARSSCPYCCANRTGPGRELAIGGSRDDGQNLPEFVDEPRRNSGSASSGKDDDPRDRAAVTSEALAPCLKNSRSGGGRNSLGEKI